MKSQTNAIEKQVQNQIRPWITIGELRMVENNVGGTLYSVDIKNIWTNYTEIVYSKFMKKFESFTREDLWKCDQFENTFPLMPNETYPFPAGINNDEYISLNTTPYFIGLHIAYKVNDKFDTVGKIWKIDKTVFRQIDSWVNKEPE